MCAPSEAMKGLNNTVQDFTRTMTSQAGTVFGSANTVFNNILNATQSIVKGGPSQAGYSAPELSALNAENVNEGGAMARNMKGAADSSIAAIGGGNVPAPSGSTTAMADNAETAAAARTAQGSNDILKSDYETGRQNFFGALGGEESAPNEYSVANGFNQAAASQQQTAMKSQQNIDTQSNWWKSALMKVVTTNPMDMAKGMMSKMMPSGGGGGDDDSSSSSSGDSDGSDSGTMDSGSGDMGGGAGAGAAAAA